MDERNNYGYQTLAKQSVVGSARTDYEVYAWGGGGNGYTNNRSTIHHQDKFQEHNGMVKVKVERTIL